MSFIMPVTAALFLEYTKEELIRLKDIISNVCGSTGRLYWGLPIKNALVNCVCNPYQLSTYPFDDSVGFDLFTIDMIKLPLYINDEDPEKAAIAKWRLFLGR
jgi:hypothetical protein